MSLATTQSYPASLTTTFVPSTGCVHPSVIAEAVWIELQFLLLFGLANEHFAETSIWMIQLPVEF